MGGGLTVDAQHAAAKDMFSPADRVFPDRRAGPIAGECLKNVLWSGWAELKWANLQEAVIISWLPAHSILKWIGGDSSMLDPLLTMSRAFLSSCPKSMGAGAPVA